MDNDQNWDEEYEDSLKNIPFHEGNIKLEEKYVYESEIGKGAYGCVMCGYRESDHCSVAIKVIPSRLVSDWYTSKVLKRRIPLEVLLLVLTRKIDGVISIEEFYEDTLRSNWYIVMKRYMKTMDLFEYITSLQYLTEDVACSILYQLMIIIIDCHLLGVVHRDIKEENILIDPSTKKIWLIDFGSGSLMRDDHHTSYNGTLSYASPEWLRRGHYRGCQLESWTMGIVLYSMLCGSVPFEDEEQILSGVVRFPRKLSPTCVDLILRCLESDPDLRIQPFEMLSHPWVIFNKKLCDSGRGSFDESIIETPKSRKCSCSCGENIPCQNKEDHEVAVIETIAFDPDCIKEIDSEKQFRVISKSLSPDSKRKTYLCSAKSVDQINEPITSYKDIPTVEAMNGDLFYYPRKKTSLESEYEEDIDDNYQYEEDSFLISNDDFF